MCNFFSCVSDGKGKVYYFDAKIRKEIIAGKSKYELTDSHTSIADHYGFTTNEEDKLNKYEYNPLTKIFTVDQINTTDDRKTVKKFCQKLDFGTIVPELIVKSILNPFCDVVPPKRITKKHLKLLKIWASVRNSVGGSVWASVRNSVWDSARDSVGASVWGSVWGSVLGSIKGLVWAYVSSFFNIPYPYDFSSASKLWEMGLVPSFDGSQWSLHGNKDRGVLWTGKIK